MKIWFDTEFIEDGRTIDLLSIGAVREDGKEFYFEAECDTSRASDWVKQNVLPHLKGPPQSRGWIAQQFREFAGEKPEFWAYYADYDWVVLCQLYGTMMDLPKGWPMYCRDVKQVCDDIGNPKLPEQSTTEHHALADARWTREAWEFLRQRSYMASVAASAPTVIDFDDGEISVRLDGKELRGWSYASDDERRTKMLAAREYVEGWCDGRDAR